ncbi:MAG: LytR C-terminal domain-containing protein [Candidatus Marinimicrobia bacterium]|nr:LytR C-terminal domain-containing protein [Candidatus Neomarinimicrobiota bacterium]MDD4962055.1 LytR C-terminal domain-containing protein [Candidatus Neomarinimicrobiota bacterium]MDD5709021.1 LytR C-terminal domain-containing protein [Candidatus Neomarinimicrobiota bacterium]
MAIDAKLLNRILNVLIILILVLVGFFAYSALVDRPARLREFAQSEISRDVPDMRTAAQSEKESLHIVVRILNGCGVSGVAYKLREYLLTQGFDVVETTNAEHFNYDKTIIYLHRNDFQVAKQVSDKLRMPNNPFLDNRTPDYPCDVTIVIGKDYQTLPPFSNE